MHPSIQSHPRKSPWGRPPGSDIVWPRPMFLDLPRGSQSMARDAPPRVSEDSRGVGIHWDRWESNIVMIISGLISINSGLISINSG